jgi:hypothetical protein
MALAILNAAGRVVTFVRDDVPEGWTPPDGCTAIPQSELPAGWKYAGVDLAELREQRNERLSASDWTQVADAPVDRTAWAAYRQALRDLPSVYSGTGPIPWPQEPA